MAEEPTVGVKTPDPRRMYLAGPMSGYVERNFPYFYEVAVWLRRHYDVVNPAELNSVDEHWHVCMKEDIGGLLACNALVLLNGWQNSRGALIELLLARVLDYELFICVDRKSGKGKFNPDPLARFYLHDLRIGYAEIFCRLIQAFGTEVTERVMSW